MVEPVSSFRQFRVKKLNLSTERELVPKSRGIAPRLSANVPMTGGRKSSAVMVAGNLLGSKTIEWLWRI